MYPIQPESDPLSHSFSSFFPHRMISQKSSRLPQKRTSGMVWGWEIRCRLKKKRRKTTERPNDQLLTPATHPQAQILNKNFNGENTWWRCDLEKKKKEKRKINPTKSKGKSSLTIPSVLVRKDGGPIDSRDTLPRSDIVLQQRSGVKGGPRGGGGLRHLRAQVMDLGSSVRKRKKKKKKKERMKNLGRRTF